MLFPYSRSHAQKRGERSDRDPHNRIGIECPISLQGSESRRRCRYVAKQQRCVVVVQPKPYPECSGIRKSFNPTTTFASPPVKGNSEDGGITCVTQEVKRTTILRPVGIGEGAAVIEVVMRAASVHRGRSQREWAPTSCSVISCAAFRIVSVADRQTERHGWERCQSRPLWHREDTTELRENRVSGVCHYLRICPPKSTHPGSDQDGPCRKGTPRRQSARCVYDRS